MNVSVYIPDDDPVSKQLGPAEEQPFCVLCLRDRPGGEYYQFSSGPALEFRETLKTVMGIELIMDDFDVCSPCWKMIHLMVDFRTCCLKAQEELERFGRGTKCEDEWFNDEVVQAIENLRSVIQQQMVQIKSESICSEDDVQVETILIEEDSEGHSPQYEQVNQGANELETQISVGEFKIEVFDDVEEVAATGSTTIAVEVIQCEECNQFFESELDLQVHAQHCKSHTNEHQGTKQFECRKYCKERFLSMPARLAHEKRCITGEERSERNCPICDARLANLGSLRSHMSCVHGERKHQCQFCVSRFTRTYELTRHCRVVHSVDIRKGKQPTPEASPVREESRAVEPKPTHKCSTCSKEFKKYSSLIEHTRR